MENKPALPKKAWWRRAGYWTLATVAILLLACTILYFSSDWIARMILVPKLAGYCGTKVTIETIHCSPEQSRLDLENLSIANPKGFSSRPALFIQTAAIDVTFASLWKEEKEIEELNISGLTLFYEQLADGRDNLSVIKENIYRKIQESSKEDGECRYRVKKLHVSDARVVLLINNQESIVKIDDIEMCDIGAEKALTRDELAAQILLHYSGKFNVSEIAIRNPAGFTEKDFIHINNLSVELDMTGLPHKHYRIKSIDIGTFSFNMETLADQRNNMKEIAAEVVAHQAQKKLSSPSDGDERIEIDEFCIQNMTLVISNNGVSKRVPLGKLELKALGKKKPYGKEKMALKLMEQVNAFINNSGSKVSQAQDELRKETMPAPQNQ